MMESLISLLQAGSDLLPDQVEQAVGALTAAEIPDEQKVQFLKALCKKGETAAEIAAFAQAMLRRAVRVDLDSAALPGPTIDVCGTGGDRQGFFNVSSTSMFVVAACGACVVKHGNRSITSLTGAADVLEQLGVRIDLGPAELRSTLEQHGAAFIFAPAYHPAVKALMPARKILAAEGITTVFNLLGPLLNPVHPKHQLVGIFSASLLTKYAEALRMLGRRCAWAVHGQGTDELTLTGPSHVHAVEDGKLRAFEIDPGDLGLAICKPDDLRGGDRTVNAEILERILDGRETGPKRDVVLLNTAAALVVCGIAPTLFEGLARAREAIASGAALAKLNVLRTAKA